jgi:hypothetical protein
MVNLPERVNLGGGFVGAASILSGKNLELRARSIAPAIGTGQFQETPVGFRHGMPCRHVSMKPIREKAIPCSDASIPCSVEKIPCSVIKNSLFFGSQGIGVQAFDLSDRLDTKNAKAIVPNLT